MPDILYTDNGTNFTPKHLQQVAADLKIRLVFSIPGKPQGRGRIELFFRTVNLRQNVKTLSTGASPITGFLAPSPTAT